MTASRTDPAEDYLRRLSDLLSDLPSDQRADVLAGIEEHLALVRGSDDVERAIARLGTPEQVARAARRESGVDPAPPSAWPVWVAGVSATATVLEFTLLGALLAITARFDDDADWNISPALALFAIGMGLVAGLFASIVASRSRAWRALDALWLTLLWVGMAVLAIGGSALTPALPLGLGFVVAGVELLAGGLAAVSAVLLLLRTLGRRTGR